MANIITISDFSSPYLVYAVTGDDSNTILNDLITYYEKLILTQILGEIEYNDYIANPSNTEWGYFVDGHTYTYNSESYVYPGIKPILTKFLYYYWQVETSSSLAESGQLKKNLVNSIQIVPAHKMVRAYNEAIDLISNDREYSPTVYNFLDHMQSENDYFPDWEYTTFEKINTFNL